MSRIIRLLSCMVVGWLACAPAFAAEFASPDEAKAMTERAVAFVHSEGKDKAFAAFNVGSDGFKDRDLYVFVYNKDGICAAHGGNTAMVGKLLIGLKDADSREIVKDIVSIPATGWVDYKWRNPETQEIMKKHAYIIHDGDYWYGVGSYQK